MSADRIETSFVKAVECRAPYEVLRITNDEVGVEFLPQMIGAEVMETEAEHQLENLLLYRFFEHAKELGDVLFSLYAFCTAHGILPDFIEAWSRANGQALHSDIYDQLYERAVNLHEGDQEKNVTEFLTYVISLSHHLPLPMDIVSVMAAVIKKNTTNRPLEYYLPFDSQGNLLTNDQLMQKHYHVERILRFLRNTFGSPLPAWAHEPFRERVMDFNNSDEHFTFIQLNVRSVLTNHVSDNLRRPVQSKNGSARVTTAQLEAAGGVKLSWPAEMNYQQAA